MTFDTIGTPNGGFSYQLLKVIATNAGFNYTYEKTMNSSIYLDESFYLEAIVPSIDIYVGKPLQDSSDSRNKGIAFTTELTDETNILVSIIPPSDPFDYWKFLKPFSHELWAAVFGAILLFSFVIYFIDFSYRFMIEKPKTVDAEKINEVSMSTKKHHNDSSFVLSAEKSIDGISLTTSEMEERNKLNNTKSPPPSNHNTVLEKGTNHNDINHQQVIEEKEPITLFNAILGGIAVYFSGSADLVYWSIPIKVTILSFSFFIFILQSSYLANLSAILISLQNSNAPVVDINDANSRSLQVCAIHGNTVYTDIIAGYPRIQLVSYATEDPLDIAIGLNNGKCNAAAMTVSDFSIIRKKTSANPICGLSQVGDSFGQYSGSW